MLPVLIVTGPVGAGKSSVTVAIADQLGAANRPHAIIDMDAMRSCYPSPPDDPFHTALGYRNAAALAANFRAAGAERLIVPDVIETRADLASYQTAIPDAQITLVRLTAPVTTLHARLRKRQTDASLDWYLHRAGELQTLMDERRLENLLIDTEGKSIEAVAREILAKIGWAG